MTRLHVATRAALATVLALLAVIGALSTSPALAADETPAPVSWSVSPANESGKDDRHSIEHEVDPGESVKEHLAVRNLGGEEVTFRLSSADGYYNKNGRFDMLASDKKSVDAGTWIDMASSVTIAAGESAVLPFTVVVPQDAEPGDHIAGVAASVMSTQQGDGAAVGVESRVGFRVIIRVKGEIVPTYAVKKLTTDYELSWNPFRPGVAVVSFEVVNTGNARLSAKGDVDVAGQKVAFPAEGEPAQMLLPGDRRPFSVTVENAWPLFAVTGDLNVAPTASSFGGDDIEVKPTSASIFVWALPWPHIIIVFGLGLIVLALAWSRIRSRRRLQSLLAQAREQGRQENRPEGDA